MMKQLLGWFGRFPHWVTYVFIVIILIVAAGVWLMLRPTSTTNTLKPEPVSVTNTPAAAVTTTTTPTSTPAPTPKATPNATAKPTATPAAQLVNCGTVVEEDSSTDAFAGCFDNHYYPGCSKASITATVPDSVPGFGGTSVYYEIQAKSGANCLVKWRYLKLPSNPSWENQDIFCPYTEVSDFNAALNANSSFDGCYGPLYNTINS